MKKLLFSVCSVLAISGCGGENVDELPPFDGRKDGGGVSNSYVYCRYYGDCEYMSVSDCNYYGGTNYGSDNTCGGGGFTPPSNSISLTQGQWKDGNISSGGSQAYSFSVTSGTTYYVWWNDSYQGDGTKTLDVKVTAYYSNGANIFEGEDNGYNSPKSFTASSSSTVYFIVTSYSSGNTGTFSIVYSTNSTRPSTNHFNPNIQYISFTDSRDSRIYKSVRIGSQTWMAENLNYNATGSRCYGDNSGGDSQNRCGTYGRLYNWETAMAGSGSSDAVPSGIRGVCPYGWHLPSDAEWTILTDYVGGSSLKSAIGWYSGGNGTDDYGFSALPGGYGNSGGNFGSVGNDGRWWSATEDNSYDAWYRYMYNDESGVYRYNHYKSYLFSVRCLYD